MKWPATRLNRASVPPIVQLDNHFGINDGAGSFFHRFIPVSREFKSLRPLFNHAKVNGGFGHATGFEQLVKDKIIALLEVSTPQSLLRSLIVPV